jgi:AraC family transcriptional regulator, regulatory protein of adaptative response / methylated-DNA-[protein]-cysteine methyltransferase
MRTEACRQFGFSRMMRATMDRDSSYDGKFWVGVKSTGIYCLPSCKAKKPLPKNILFFATREEALKAGLRGCKRCKSEKFPDVEPSWLKTVIFQMKTDLSRKLDEKKLSSSAGVDISTIRRYFKAHFNITVMAYHRKLRLQRAKEMLKNGASYLDAAYECGYESASGFRSSFIKEFGETPGGIYGRKNNL